ncbi:calmodulin-binding receptor-like cytoplasmic kinase 2 [Iris pallida]|uniref:Calmodulin-binding receptor-like cytoplasmic kinase 2 n=1 Tax=Iris pallida TaxID=29817 RepID=A0AAX6G9A6_IRIPA|nr:calmodulin-binding receptor-like cytoplasmic kinase 2 [Iris pallida]
MLNLMLPGCGCAWATNSLLFRIPRPDRPFALPRELPYVLLVEVDDAEEEEEEDDRTVFGGGGGCSEGEGLRSSDKSGGGGRRPKQDPIARAARENGFRLTDEPPTGAAGASMAGGQSWQLTIISEVRI